MGIMALLAIIFGSIQLGKIPMTDDQKSTFHIPGLTDGAKGIGYGVLFLGMFGILVACLGCVTGKFKNPCFAFPYGLLTFLVTIVFLIITIIAGSVSSEQGKTSLFNLACGGPVKLPGQPTTTTSNLDLAATYSQYVDQPMCSVFCPCPVADAFSSSTLSQASLMKQGRYVDKSLSKGIGYTTQPSDQTIKMQDLNMLQFGGSTTYDTYEKCFNEVLSKP